MTTAPAPPRLILWLVAGFSVWGLALVAVYVLHAIGCAFGWPAGPLRIAMAVLLLAHVAALIGMWQWLRRPRPAHRGASGDFLRTTGLWATAAALISTVLLLGPPLALATCI